MAWSMHEIEDELSDIKREIIESRGLVIRTNNLTNALSADIKSISKRQQGYERRIALNSVTAYVVFVVVAFAAFKVAIDARVDAIDATSKHLREENVHLRQDLDELRQREASRRAAELEAAKYYDLIREGKRPDIVRAWDIIKTKPLSKAEAAFMADAVAKAKAEQATALYLQGIESAHLQRWQEAASAFEESLRYDDTTASSPEAKFELANAYRKLRKQKEAVAVLTPLTEQGNDKEVLDDALELLAWCQTDLDAFNDAKNTWRMLLRRFPDSHFVPEAKLALQTLMQNH
jgi:TolA-binding protein